jgi:hypothetical protein
MLFVSFVTTSGTGERYTGNFGLDAERPTSMADIRSLEDEIVRALGSVKVIITNWKVF